MLFGSVLFSLIVFGPVLFGMSVGRSARGPLRYDFFVRRSPGPSKCSVYPSPKTSLTSVASSSCRVLSWVK